MYDLDGDGKAEVICKTADGTVDGAGTVIGDAKADHRNADGYVLDGPEYLTVFDGLNSLNVLCSQTNTSGNCHNDATFRHSMSVP